MVELINHTLNSIFRKNPIQRVFPNPVTYFCSIMAGGSKYFKIYGQGKQKRRGPKFLSQLTKNISHLPKGRLSPSVYIIQLPFHSRFFGTLTFIDHYSILVCTMLTKNSLTCHINDCHLLFVLLQYHFILVLLFSGLLVNIWVIIGGASGSC